VRNPPTIWALPAMVAACGSSASTIVDVKLSASVQSEEGKATTRETVAAMLDRSNREFVPIRRSFVQAPDHGGGPGPLAAFVSQRRGRALDLYLLCHAVASSPPYDVSFASQVWARALGIEGKAGSSSAISRSWTWLEECKLVSSERRGRRKIVSILKEDGSGSSYTHPGSQGRYLKLPYAYWRGNFNNRIGLPAKAVLLIALSQRREFVLPADQAASWYGISRETIQRGLRTLRLLGILEGSTKVKKAPLAPSGITRETHYSLRDPFSPMDAIPVPNGG